MSPGACWTFGRRSDVRTKNKKPKEEMEDGESVAFVETDFCGKFAPRVVRCVGSFYPCCTQIVCFTSAGSSQAFCAGSQRPSASAWCKIELAESDTIAE